VRPAWPARALLLSLVLLSTACANKFEPVPPPTPNLLGTYVGNWGDQPTTLVIQSYGSAPPDGGLFLGTMSVGGLAQMQVSGTISHPSPQGPLASTFTARVGYVNSQLILSLSLPGTSDMELFEELPLAVDGNALVGKAERDYPEGPKGSIKLVRQQPAPRAPSP
jgi:hypothetical protein